MVLGFDEYIGTLLLEAKSPEEVVSILSARYPEMPVEIIKEVVNIDPTKKKSYSAWVFRVEKRPMVVDSYVTSGTLSAIFRYFQDNAKDGANLVDKESLQEAEKYLPDFTDMFKHDYRNEEANDYEICFKSDEWIVAIPHSYEASKRLGQNTKWCTADAYGNGTQYWNSYNGNNRTLWMNFDCRKQEILNGVTYPFKRYQFCFQTGEFLDALDKKFEPEDIDMPEDVANFYREKGLDIDRVIMSEEELEERYREERYADGCRVLGDIWLLREWNRHYRVNEAYYYRLYDISEDDSQPLTAIYYTKDGIEYQTNDLVIIREMSGEEVTIILNDYIDTGVKRFTPFEYHGASGVIYVRGNAFNKVCCAYGNVNCYTEVDGITNDSELIFNTEITNAVGSENIVFFEVSRGRFHSLFALVANMDRIATLVKLDIPEDGESYKIDEDGTIHAKYRKRYNFKKLLGIGNDVFLEDEGSYEMIRQLKDERYILIESDFGQNIMSSESQENRPLFDEDFSELVHDLSTSNGAIIVSSWPDGYAFKEDMYGKKKPAYCVLSLTQGKRTSNYYDLVAYIGGKSADDKAIIVGAYRNENLKPVDNERFVLTERGDIKVHTVQNKGIDGKAVTYVEDNSLGQGKTVTKILDTNTGRFYPEWRMTNQMSLLFKPEKGYGTFYCFNKDDNDYVIYDWVNDRILLDNVQGRVTDYERHNDTLTVFKLNDEKYNIFLDSTNSIILPQNASRVYRLPGQCCISAEYPDREVVISYESHAKVLCTVMKYDGMSLAGYPDAVYVTGKVGEDAICLKYSVPEKKIYQVLDTYNEEGVANTLEIGDAPNEIRAAALKIFAPSLSTAQQIAERMNRIRKL